ncbi:MAG: RidA family protein [Bdellovibrio sp.]|jgi:2-iminobutanoate/2-iminopropanoate deaminase
MKKVLHTDHAPAAIGPYSQAIQAGPFVFCSGQIALSADKNVAIPADVKSQTVQVMKNVEAVLHGAGLKFENVVKTTIFLTDMNDFQAVNEIYGQHFAQNPPARSTVAVAGLPRGVKVEIEVLAFKD